nr:MAG TPA: L SHAPED TAIL FIBER PROTEIN [Caudoviricetes sp.]
MQIKIIIKTQRLTLSSNKIVCGTNNFIECLFDFQSSDWTELEKWALFKDGQNTYEMYIQDNKCIIPAQCISDQGEVIMSVVGRNNGKNITATAEDKLLLISGRAFDNPDEERLTPTYLEEVLGKVRDESLKAATSEANAAQSAQEAADSAAAALQSEKNAKASERAAETSKEAAAQSEANSKTSEDAARGYADDAEASKGAAAALAVQAAGSANAAAESAKQAVESEKKAAQSETNAKLSETNSKTSETNSQNSASESAQSAANAEKSNKSAEKHSTDAGASADNAELSAQQVTELAEQVNRDAMQVASDKKSVTELTGQAVKAAGNAQTYMEQTGQIKTDTQTITDSALQAMAEVITKAKADIDVQGTEIITQATAQADRAQSAADGIRDTADTLQADNEHLKADLKHANRRISVLYDLGKGITHRYETDNDTAYSKEIPSGAKVMDVKMIGGKSVVGNNQILLKDFDKEVNGVHVKFDSAKASITLTGTLTDINYSIPLFDDSIPITPRHKYYKENQTTLKLSYRVLEAVGENSISWSIKNTAEILTAPDNAHFCVCYIYSEIRYPGPPVGTVFNETFNAILVDLTQMFGAGNEPTLEQCREIFSSESYPYNAGTLTSADVTAVQVGDNVIQLPNSISLKSAGSVYDSLEFYEADGKYYQKHTQRVGVIMPIELASYDINYTTTNNIPIFVMKCPKLNERVKPIQTIQVNRYTSAMLVGRPANVDMMCINDGASVYNLCWRNDSIQSAEAFQKHLVDDDITIYYELATPIVTVTEVDNCFDAVDCKAGDKITFVGNSDYHLPVPNEEEYLIALNEVTA